MENIAQLCEMFEGMCGIFKKHTLLSGETVDEILYDLQHESDARLEQLSNPRLTDLCFEDFCFAMREKGLPFVYQRIIARKVWHLAGRILTVKTLGIETHCSVGAVIRGEHDSILLISRKKPPLGFAGVAGHLEEYETPEEALIREIREETGLWVAEKKRLFAAEMRDNECRHGVKIHIWHLFECRVVGEPHRNEEEAECMRWYSQYDIQDLAGKGLLEPVWHAWFAKLGIIK